MGIRSIVFLVCSKFTAAICTQAVEFVLPTGSPLSSQWENLQGPINSTMQSVAARGSLPGYPHPFRRCSTALRYLNRPRSSRAYIQRMNLLCSRVKIQGRPSESVSHSAHQPSTSQPRVFSGRSQLPSLSFFHTGPISAGGNSSAAASAEGSTSVASTIILGMGNHPPS